MASHLAAQDYLARFQASGMNFPSLSNTADLQYPSLGLHSLSSHHKSSRSSKSSSSLSKGQGNTKDKASPNNSYSGDKRDRSKSPSMPNSKPYLSNSKYEAALSVQSSMKQPVNSNSPGPIDNKSSGKINDLGCSKDKAKSSSSSGSVKSGGQSVSSIFTSPLSLASNTDKGSASVSTTQSIANCSVAALPSSSILR